MKKTVEKRTVEQHGTSVMIEELTCVCDGSAVVACTIVRKRADAADLLAMQWLKPLCDTRT